MSPLYQEVSTTKDQLGELCWNSHVHALAEDESLYNYSPGNDLAAANTIHKSANVDNKLINVLKLQFWWKKRILLKLQVCLDGAQFLADPGKARAGVQITFCLLETHFQLILPQFLFPLQKKIIWPLLPYFFTPFYPFFKVQIGNFYTSAYSTLLVYYSAVCQKISTYSRKIS